MKKHYSTKEVKAVMRDAVKVAQIKNEVAFLPSEIDESMVAGDLKTAIEKTKTLNMLLLKMQRLISKNSDVDVFERLLESTDTCSTVENLFGRYCDYFEIFD